MHDKDNPFDFFAIKVSEKNSVKPVELLAIENSQATKFLLKRGARIITNLPSCNYCVPPLVQGEFETPCRVEIYMTSI